jgi:hypothetical protein
MLRGLLAGVACAVFVAVGWARAQAAAEFCPATLVGEPAQIDATSYRFKLGAISPRTVSGVIRVQTTKGWYAISFSDVVLKQLTQDYSDQGATFSHEDYLSNDIIVKFPPAATPLYSYVVQAEAKGDTFLNWDRFGTVACSPTPFSPKDKRNAARPMPPLSKDPIVLTPTSVPTPVLATCAEPFKDVVTIKPGPFHYPAILGRDDPSARPTGVTVVVVAVDRDGSVVDAWVWEPIGTPMLDQAVVNEARKATYAPGKAFCENVPGYFVLRSTFVQ